jgi:hypothetical protein
MACDMASSTARTDPSLLFIPYGSCSRRELLEYEGRPLQVYALFGQIGVVCRLPIKPDCPDIEVPAH